MCLKYMKPLYLSSPCPADLNKMSPQQAGFFCKSCSKCVIDCREMSDAELRNLPKNSCGIFSPEQVEIPKYNWTKSIAFKVLMLAGVLGFNVKPLSAQSTNTKGPELVEILHQDGSPSGRFKQKKKAIIHTDEPKKKKRRKRRFRRRRAVMGKTMRIGCPDF